MSEEIKKFWDNAEILAVKAWYESTKGFEQIDRENNFSVGTLYRLVNSIQDYRGTRCSIGKWLRMQLRHAGVDCISVKSNTTRKGNEKMQKKSTPQTKVTDQDKIEHQLMRELDEARRKIARLEAQQKKDSLRRDFLEGQLEEYRKLVKPSQSKKSNTK